MIKERTKPGGPYPYPNEVDLVNSSGNTDYIQDGVLYKDSPVRAVLVTAESDLANLTALYEPGTIAYTAGFNSVWQLDAAGNWVEV